MPEPQGQLTIRTDGDADDLFQLLEWFNDDDELRGRVDLLDQAIRPGEMGGLADALVVTLGTGGIGTAMVTALTGWFTHRRSDLAITVTLDDHASITFDGKRVELPAAADALQSLLAQLNERQ